MQTLDNKFQNSLSEKDFKQFKKWLKGHLKFGPVTVTFVKKDGSDRTMKCTTNPTYILFKNPELFESKKEKKSNEDVMPVYDLDSQEWRSFRWDSVKQVSFTLGEEDDHSNKTQ
jgi:hypothetical protein